MEKNIEGAFAAAMKQAASRDKASGIELADLAGMNYYAGDSHVLEEGMTLFVPEELHFLSTGVSAYFMCPVARRAESEPNAFVKLWITQFLSARMMVEPKTRMCIGLRFHGGTIKDYGRTRKGMADYWEGLQGAKIYIKSVERILMPVYRADKPYRVGEVVEEGNLREGYIYEADEELAVWTTE